MQWHFITPEYPPQLGGVSDYTQQLAAGLAGQGDEVHVWCPGAQESDLQTGGVEVHRKLGAFTPADLERFGKELDRFPAPRRILVQYVPHGYGYRSMNVAFCWWLRQRVRRHGDHVELMVHEPFLSFRRGALRQNAAALVHRFMTVLLLSAVSHVWISIPAWEQRLRPYALRRALRFEWLPIFSNIPIATEPLRIHAVRRRYVHGEEVLMGHFGTYGSLVATLLEPILCSLASDPNRQTVLLMGAGSEQFRQALIRKEPRLEAQLQATGKLSPEELSYHLAACDMLIQPYPDGVSSRRTSFMAGLSHGKPIVTTSGELTEALWTSSGATSLAPAGDTAAFLDQVRRLRANAIERLRMGGAASQLYQDRFDISHILSALSRAESSEDN